MNKRIYKLAQDINDFHRHMDRESRIRYELSGDTQTEVNNIYNNIYNNTGVEEARLYVYQYESDDMGVIIKMVSTLLKRLKSAHKLVGIR